MCVLPINTVFLTCLKCAINTALIVYDTDVKFKSNCHWNFFWSVLCLVKYFLFSSIFIVSQLWPLFTEFVKFPHKWHCGKILQCILCASPEQRSSRMTKKKRLLITCFEQNPSISIWGLADQSSVLKALSTEGCVSNKRVPELRKVTEKTRQILTACAAANPWGWIYLVCNIELQFLISPFILLE